MIPKYNNMKPKKINILGFTLIIIAALPLSAGLVLGASGNVMGLFRCLLGVAACLAAAICVWNPLNISEEE